MLASTNIEAAISFLTGACFLPIPIMNPVLWQCHKCGNGPMKYANASQCPGCGHDYCGSCKTDDNIPPILKLSRDPRKNLRNMQSSNYMAPETINPPTPPASTSASINRNKLKLGTRPSMRGWWKCDKCGYLNNPALNPEKCFDCSHSKCIYCTTRQS